MNIKIKNSLLLFLITASSAFANTDSPWTDINTKQSQRSMSSLSLLPDNYRLLQLNEDQLKSTLGFNKQQKANKLSTTSAQQIVVPLPDGSSLTLNVIQSQTMAPELATKYPQIKTYKVDSHLNNGIYGVVDLTEQGFHAMLFTKDGKRIFIDPRSSASQKFYISYLDTDYHPPEKKPHICKNPEHQHTKNNQLQRSELQQRSGAELKTYKLAMAATGEYTTFQGGTVNQALSAITTTVSRVNVIYERDLATKLELVANNNLLIFTNAATDPFTPSDPGLLLNQNQTLIDNTIGSANYDIGHVVGTGGGGLAGLGVVCDNARKAEGETGSPQPVGDAFDIDFVAHEIGHQFGGTHTFNGTTGNCAGSNREASTAYEPGSGTSIMAYAGICGSDNIQNNSDAMFHIASITQISSFIDSGTGNSCGTNSSLNNQQPVANAGSDYNIPANTPFELAGTASDANQDVLSYSWEQLDSGQASNANQDTSDNAIFRAFLPKSEPTRVFPTLTDILANNSTLGEILPSTVRTVNFSFSVRDGKGGVNSDEMKVNVSSSTGFKVTSHTSPETLAAGSTILVSWDIAGTTSAPVSCSNVLISLSTDGGNTFTDVSGGTTANDGSENITIPANVNSTTTARFKVKCANNIFFDLSDANLTTVSNPDIDNDMIPNILDNCPNTANTDQLNTDNDTQGNVCDDDDDNDGMPDTWENQFNLNPLDPQDATIDTDGDGRNNLQEFLDGTDPRTKDLSPGTLIIPIISLLLLDD